MIEQKLTPTFSDNKGFTLVEVMIALAILSFIMLAVISISDSSQESASRVIAEDQEILQVEAAFSRIEWDLSQVWSPLHFSHEMQPIGLNEYSGQVYNQVIDYYSQNQRFAFPSYEGLPVPIFSLEDKHTLTIFTLSNRRRFKDSKQSHFQWVQYTIDESPQREQLDVLDVNEARENTLSLQRKIINEDVFSTDELRWDQVRSQTLLRGVESLVFELWNPETRRWTDQINTIKNGRHKINGLKITMEWVDSDGIIRQFIRIMRPLMPIHFVPENMYQLERSGNTDGTTINTRLENNEDTSEQ